MSLKRFITLNIFTINDIKVDIVNYPYPWLQNNLIVDNINLASISDIAAITGKGTMKDFIDLYYLLKQFSLKQILQFYEQEYTDASIFMALKSLSFFDDADTDIMPKIFEQVKWNDIKLTISKQLKYYVDKQ